MILPELQGLVWILLKKHWLNSILINFYIFFSFFLNHLIIRVSIFFNIIYTQNNNKVY